MNVFGIGMSKTGSSSVDAAAMILGYAPNDPLSAEGISDVHPPSLDPSGPDYYCKLTNVCTIFDAVDAKFPGSKFILTVRDMESWLKSARHQFRVTPEPGTHSAEIRQAKFGTVEFDVEKFAEAYDRHVNRVRKHFQTREEDLLVINVVGGEGWDKLCPFLGKPVPGLPFPRKNVSRSPRRLYNKIRRLLGLKVTK